MPDPQGDWQYVYTAFKCRDFPKSVSDRCDEGNRLFCVEWISAGYLAQLGVGFGIMALLALLIGVSTHSRRRRVWKAVAGLVTLNGAWSTFFSLWALMGKGSLADHSTTPPNPPFTPPQPSFP